MGRNGTLTGKVVKLTRDKGFGFLKSDDGQEHFFHRSSAPDFDAMHEGAAVRFEAVDPQPPKGPRADRVELI